MKKPAFGYFVLTLFIMLLTYNFHRYIFMYNDSGTSPTYSDTPAVWKIAKYALLAVLMGMIYAQVRFYQFKGVVINLIYFFLFWCVAINIIWSINSSANNVEFPYLMCALMLLPVMYMSEEDKAEISTFFEKYLLPVAVITILTDAYVIANYFLTGRLTALSYEGDLLRFGGLWDDPNGFGVFCSFLAYGCLVRKKWVLFALLAVCVYYTVSFTAYFNLLVAIGLWGMKDYKPRPALKYAGLGLALLGFLAVVTGALKSFDFFSKSFSQKQGSIQTHGTVDFQFSLFPYFQHGPVGHETWYISFFYNFSPLSPFFLILIWVYLVRLILRHNKTFAEVYMILFLVEASFIPMMFVFPLNVIFILFFFTTEIRNAGIFSRSGYQASIR